MASILPTEAASAAGTGSLLLTASGLAAAFALASCCGFPLLLASAGLGTAWITGFALLVAPQRSVLLVMGAAGLTGRKVLFWRQQRAAACNPGIFCSRPAIRNLTLAGLVQGAGFLYLGCTYA